MLATGGVRPCTGPRAMPGDLPDEALEPAASTALPSPSFATGVPTRPLTPHPLPYDPSNVFARILRGELPAQLLHEDEHCIAFRDVAPQAPLHVLVVPRRPIRTLGEAATSDAPMLGHLLLTAAALAKRLGHPEARIVINNGVAAGQSVFHLHVHVLAGRPLSWPPG
jgi:histidine triad (HIT) family protein